MVSLEGYTCTQINPTMQAREAEEALLMEELRTQDRVAQALLRRCVFLVPSTEARLALI